MTHPNRVHLSKLTLGLLAALATAPVFAQSTSAGLSGMVTGDSGQPVTGAQVVITHVESGTVSRATTDGSGRYSSRGLRVGGPYTVSVTKDGQTSVQENVYLGLGDVSTVNASLAAGAGADDATTLEAVQAVASSAVEIISPDSMGAASVITREQIEVTPTIRRSIEDIARLDPRIVQIDEERGGITAAGQNNRYNNIRIDGVPTNDNFGLNDSGMPSLNNPISIDWIESFNIGVSDYDTTQSDFVGANINAVTKSGTNEFHGSIYGIYRNDDMIGDEIDGRPAAAPFKDETTYGGYIGGPIIKDKLFFFAGYEKYEKKSPSAEKGIQGSGAANEFGITAADVTRIENASARYGQPSIGSFDPISEFTNEDEKWFAKVDWNITENQRATVRYNKTEGSVLRLNTTTNNLQASSNWYSDNISFENWAALLYSDWTDNFSTEFNTSYSEYRSTPESFSRFPQVSITFPNSAPGGGNGFALFGQERSRQSNVLATDTWTAFFAGTLFLNDHELKFGVDYEKADVYNLFLQDSIGNYEFNSLADYERGRWSRYRFQRSRTGDIDDAAATFKVGTLGLFVQDTWSVNNNLTLMFGVRADQTLVDGTPAYNAQFQQDFGIDNRNTPDGEWTFEPRLGFNYQFDSELRSQLRGGVGLFVGSAPGVWLSNSFSNPGVVVDAYDIRCTATSTNPDCNRVALDPNSPLVPGGAASAQQLVNGMDPDFKQPTIWKTNLAFEQELPWMGLVAGAELLYSKTKDGVLFVNEALGAPNGVLPDGRESYWSTTNPANFANLSNPTATRRVNCTKLAAGSSTCRYTNALVLKNTDEGDATNFTVSLEKPWENSWYAKLAYTYGQSDEVSPGTSSVALSNWQNRFVYNPNEDVASASNYEIRDRLTLAFSYQWKFFGDNAPTTFSMFYEGRSGRPYSFSYLNDANGDNEVNDLFYVPGGPDDVILRGTTAQQAAFWEYISRTPELARYAGSVVERNSARSPWTNQIDVHVSQKIPFGFEDMNAEVFFDILNVGNLINKDWGQMQEAVFPYRLQVANFAGVDPTTGKYIYDVSNFANGAPTLPYRNLESRWSLQVGFRLNF